MRKKLVKKLKCRESRENLLTNFSALESKDLMIRKGLKRFLGFPPSWTEDCCLLQDWSFYYQNPFSFFRLTLQRQLKKIKWKRKKHSNVRLSISFYFFIIIFHSWRHWIAERTVLLETIFILCTKTKIEICTMCLRYKLLISHFCQISLLSSFPTASFLASNQQI